MSSERDQQRRRIVDFTLQMLEAWSHGDWEKVISAASDIEQVAGELKQADEMDELRRDLREMATSASIETDEQLKAIQSEVMTYARRR